MLCGQELHKDERRQYNKEMNRNDHKVTLGQRTGTAGRREERDIRAKRERRKIRDL